MNATDLAPETTSPVLVSTNSSAEESIESWTRLVRHYYPNLATPIARALAQRAAQGPYGAALQAIAQGLAQCDDSSLHEMTGSELQMLSALLQELRERTHRLLVQVNALWHTD